MELSLLADHGAGVLTHADLFSFPSAVCQMDCCHSGSAMDLPCEMNETDKGMHENEGFGGGIGDVLEDSGPLMCCACLAFMFLDSFLG
jgi:hypothetical protein